MMSWLVTLAVSALFAAPFYFGIKRTRNRDVAGLAAGCIAAVLFVLGGFNIVAI